MNNIEFNKYIKEKGITLGSVESFTGGLFARSITAVSGASKFYKGGLVTYATEEKINLLGIDQKLVWAKGVVSKECAHEMARLGKEKLNVDLCVSFTGNAGPDAMENKPVGEVYLGISIFDRTETYGFNLEGSRDEIQNKGVELAFSLIKEVVEKYF